MRHILTLLIYPLFVVLCHPIAFSKTILIVTAQVPGVSPWDPDSTKTGIAGSEESVIYISQALAKLGHCVTVMGNPPPNSPHSHPKANPRFVHNGLDLGEIFDIAISWRLPKIGELLKAHAKKVYFWPHDTCGTYLSSSEINSFHNVLWLSQWQREHWIAFNPTMAKFTSIFGNGINTNQFHPLKQRKNPYACIYGSNYSRGLDILLDIWPTIKKQFPQATLDIYYGWKHWGALSPEKESQMRKQIQNLASLDVKEHGLVSHEELNQAYEQASLWTYPCTDPETFCITALRAQYAGAIPVIITGSALKETVPYGYQCASKETYLSTLTTALKQAHTISLEDRNQMRNFIDKKYTWEYIAKQWQETFSQN